MPNSEAMEAAYGRTEPPPCPGCGKPVWRRDHMAELITRDGADPLEFTICMHCAAMWRLSDHRTRLKPLTRAERKRVMPTAGPVAERFRIRRLLAELFAGGSTGGWPKDS